MVALLWRLGFHSTPGYGMLDLRVHLSYKNEKMLPIRQDLLNVTRQQVALQHSCIELAAIVGPVILAVSLFKSIFYCFQCFLILFATKSTTSPFLPYQT